MVGDKNDNIDDDAAAFLGGTQRVRHCILTGRIKLANLASYLPNPILCGFLLIGGIEGVVVGLQGRCGNDIGHGVRECHVDGKDRTSRADVPSVIAGAGMYFARTAWFAYREEEAVLHHSEGETCGKNSVLSMAGSQGSSTFPVTAAVLKENRNRGAP